MSIPLLDLQAQYEQLKTPIKKAIDEVLESQAFIMGQAVKELEKEIEAFTGCQHAIACASGSDALLVALMGLDVQAGDLILTSPYTFFATGGAIARLGAIPVFLDIEADSYNLDPNQLLHFMEGRHPLNQREGMLPSKVKGIMPVHLYGQTANMPTIKRLADRYGLFIVEDAAQAIGAETAGKQVGHWGDAACFSFFPSKNLGAYGDAGMMVTNNDTLAERLRVLRLHGAKPKYFHSMVGVNSRLDTIQAAILRVKLPHLNTWSIARRKAAMRYNELFNEQASIATNPNALQAHQLFLPQETYGSPENGGKHIYHQYVIRTPQRDKVLEALKKSDIGTAIYYPRPLHEQECFADLGYQASDCNIASSAAQQTLALPIFPEITFEQQQQVVKTVIEAIS